jgi:hypothetical protein
MNWILKCQTPTKYRKFSRAILGKYAQKVSASIYTVDNRAVLDAINNELQWCKERGIFVDVKIHTCGACDTFICGE